MRPSLLLLTGAFCLFYIGLMGQSALALEPAVVRKQVAVNLLNNAYEEVAKVVVRNVSGRTLRVRWDKVTIQQPAGWETQICDDQASYPPQTTTNYDPLRGINAPVVLAPGASFELYMHFFPYGRPGEATLEVPLRLVGERSTEVVQRAVFHMRVDDNSSATASPAITARNANAGNAAGAAIRVYPNPVEDRFYISNAPNLGRVEVVNALGRKVRSFDRPDASAGFNVSDLPEGVYLVSLIDDRGKTIRTLRMIRRGFRP
jgi:hypothetical protein